MYSNRADIPCSFFRFESLNELVEDARRKQLNIWGPDLKNWITCQNHMLCKQFNWGNTLVFYSFQKLNLTQSGPFWADAAYSKGLQRRCLCVRLRSPRPRSMDTNLDLVCLSKTHLFSLIQKWGRGWHGPPLSKPLVAIMNFLNKFQANCTQYPRLVVWNAYQAESSKLVWTSHHLRRTWGVAG